MKGKIYDLGLLWECSSWWTWFHQIFASFFLSAEDEDEPQKKKMKKKNRNPKKAC